MAILFGRNPWPVILSFFVCGMIAGVLFDLFKIKRHIFGAPQILLFFDDFIFMLTCGILVIFDAFAFNNGNFKWYEAPFMLFGFTVYRLTLSRLVIFCIFRVIDFVKKLLWRLFLPVLRFMRKLFVKGREVFLKALLRRKLLRFQKSFTRCYPISVRV